MLDIAFGHELFLPGLNLEELLIHILPMSMNLLGIVLPCVETRKQPLRDEVEDALLLSWSTGMATGAGWTSLRWVMR